MSTRTTLLAVLGVAPLICGCNGYGPLGEPPAGLAGVKAAAEQSESAKMGKPGVTPRAGGEPSAPTGPEGNPTVGPSDSVGPH